MPTDVFQAAEGCNGFGLTNDLTSRTTHADALHLSKCLLTTSLSSHNPTLIGDARKHDSFVLFVLGVKTFGETFSVFTYLDIGFEEKGEFQLLMKGLVLVSLSAGIIEHNTPAVLQIHQ